MKSTDSVFPTHPSAPGDGLTKRELFAAMALQGFMSCEDNAYSPEENPDFDAWLSKVCISNAELCVRYADALITVLDNKK